MWRLYGATNDCVAIRSTVARLDGIRGRDTAFFVREVIYPPIGQVTDPGNVFNSITRKRQAFQHERELRAIYTTYVPYAVHKTKERVLLYPIDPAQLIEGVAVAPGSQKWFRDLVNDQLNAAGLTMRANPSELLMTPIQLLEAVKRGLQLTSVSAGCEGCDGTGVVRSRIVAMGEGRTKIDERETFCSVCKPIHRLHAIRAASPGATS